MTNETRAKTATQISDAMIEIRNGWWRFNATAAPEHKRAIQITALRYQSLANYWFDAASDLNARTEIDDDIADELDKLRKLIDDAGGNVTAALESQGFCTPRTHGRRFKTATTTDASTTATGDDPEARAAAEWDRMSAAEQAGYFSREVFVAARRRELGGTVKISGRGGATPTATLDRKENMARILAERERASGSATTKPQTKTTREAGPIDADRLELISECRGGRKYRLRRAR